MGSVFWCGFSKPALPRFTKKLTAQSEITPRQFGAMLTLYQRGTMTLTELATHIGSTAARLAR